MNRVAICIPCYNSSEKLRRLLDSIIIQDFKDYIVIITDDSDDDTIGNLVEGYSQINIQYHKNCIRLGSTCNTNQALRYAQVLDVDYIKIMHHDDYFSSNISLSNMVSALDNSADAVLAFSNTYEMGDGLDYERTISREQIELLNADCFNLTYSNIIGAPSAVIMRKTDLLLDENLKWFVDIDWYIRILSISNKFVFIEKPLITIGLSDTQVTRECISNPMLILKENIYLYKKYSGLHCNSYMSLIIDQAEKVIRSYNVYQVCRKIANVYIYGAGEKGKVCAGFFKQNDISYKAFIVSNGKRSQNVLDGYNIIELNEYLETFRRSNDIIVLALNETNQKEVIAELKKAELEYVIWN